MKELITDGGGGVQCGWLDGDLRNLYWIENGKCQIFIWLNGSK